MSNSLIGTAEFRLVEPLQMPVKIEVKIALVHNRAAGIFEYFLSKITKTPPDIVTNSPSLFYCKYEWPKRLTLSGKKMVEADLPISYLPKLQKQARIAVEQKLKELGYTTGEYAIYTQIHRTNYFTSGTLWAF